MGKGVGELEGLAHPVEPSLLADGGWLTHAVMVDGSFLGPGPGFGK